MAAIETLYPGVLASAPSVPEVLLDRALLETARDFCRRTRYLRTQLDPISLVADTSSYALTLPTDTALVDIIGVTLNGSELTPKTVEQLRRADPDWEAATGTPDYYFREGSADIRLVGTPQADDADALVVRVALMPTLSAATIDDVLTDDHGEELVNGALFRLLKIPGKAWTDKGAADYYGALYESRIGEATHVADADRTMNVRRRVRYGGY